MEEPRRRYKVIIADPPWKYHNDNLNGAIRKNGKEHYRTCTFAEIVAMRVPAADDCLLFFWGTCPMPVECRAVIERWGFVFEGIEMVWYKLGRNSTQRLWGVGHYARSNAEYLCVATKGAFVGRVNPRMLRITAPVREPSRKPVEIYEYVLALCRAFDLGTPFEMFTRAAHPGFDAERESSEQIEHFAGVDCFTPFPSERRSRLETIVDETKRKKKEAPAALLSVPLYPLVEPHIEIPSPPHERKYVFLVLELHGLHQLNLLRDFSHNMALDSLILFRVSPTNLALWAVEMNRRKHPYATLMSFVIDPSDPFGNWWYAVSRSSPHASVRNIKFVERVEKRFDKKLRIWRDFQVRRDVSQIVHVSPSPSPNDITRAVLSQLFHMAGSHKPTCVVRIDDANNATFLTVS